MVAATGLQTLKRYTARLRSLEEAVMARSSTVYNFDIVLSDVDRGVYDTLDLKVAQHPSESPEFLVARVLAYCLELCEGLTFPPGGLSNTETPAVWVHDLTGLLKVWIDVGLPAPERLHKASKAAERVAVYVHKPNEAWLRTLAGAKVHGSAAIELYALDPAVVDAIGAALERRNGWSLSRMEGVVYLEADGGSWELPVSRVPWPS